MAKRFDILQLLISTGAIFGNGVIWFNFNKKVFTTVRSLLAAPFTDESLTANVAVAQQLIS